MKRVLVVVAFVAGVLAPLALTATPAGATPSAACATLRGPSFDDTSSGFSIFPTNLNAGERVVITAAGPATGAPTAVNLRIGGSLVDTATFPGTVSFTAPANLASTSIAWDLTPSTATAKWTVTCVDAPAQSSGCASLNDAANDAFYGSGGPISRSFNAGERITFHGAAPFNMGPPTGLELRINATQTDTAPFPGTVAFTFPTNATVSLFWSATPGANVTWTVTCTPRQTSDGCTFAQDPFNDQQLAGGDIKNVQFFAGEVLTVAGAAPASGGPTTISLTVNTTPGGSTLATRAFPGSLNYTFAADTLATVSWSTDVGTNLTWAIDCTPAPVDSTAPTCTGLAPRRAPNTLSGHDEQDVRVVDRGSGVLRIENVVISNGTPLMSVTPGQRVPVIVTAVKTTQGQPTSWSFDVLDEFGNFRHCS